VVRRQRPVSAAREKAADRDVGAGAEALLIGDERGANVIWRAEIVLDGLLEQAQLPVEGRLPFRRRDRLEVLQRRAACGYWPAASWISSNASRT
jgi:hypothetical protein